MENLRILDMNLGRRFIPIKDRKKKEILREKIKEENYDIIMMQGNSINLDYEDLGYNYINSSHKNIIFFKEEFPLYSTSVSSTGEVNSLVTCYAKRPISIVNVNCKNVNRWDLLFDSVLDTCRMYHDQNSKYFLKNMIVVVSFPKEVDTNTFCDMFDLDDVSTLVGQESHIKNNREMLNHFFISRSLEVNSIHKLVGMTERLGIGEAYPIEASISYKKVLK